MDTTVHLRKESKQIMHGGRHWIRRSLYRECPMNGYSTHNVGRDVAGTRLYRSIQWAGKANQWSCVRKNSYTCNRGIVHVKRKDVRMWSINVSGRSWGVQDIACRTHHHAL